MEETKLLKIQNLGGEREGEIEIIKMLSRRRFIFTYRESSEKREILYLMRIER